MIFGILISAAAIKQSNIIVLIAQHFTLGAVYALYAGNR